MTLLAGFVVALFSISLPGPLLLIGWLGVGAIAWWTIASLIVSYWVYDRSGLYSLQWLVPLLSSQKPVRWISVHAGLDEFTSPLRQHLGIDPLTVLDLYDPVEMTERSIARARAVSPPHPGTISAKSIHLPLPDGGCDAVFALFAVHELRSLDARTALCRELHRLLAPGGVIVVAEHLRDVPNLIAFGPGFLHFHSRASWLASFAAARLRIERESTITPFVRVWMLGDGLSEPVHTS